MYYVLLHHVKHLNKIMVMENLETMVKFAVYALMFGTTMVAGAILVAEVMRRERIREIERQTSRRKYNRSTYGDESPEEVRRMNEVARMIASQIK
jgi:hypothetical protein